MNSFCFDFLRFGLIKCRRYYVSKAIKFISGSNQRNVNVSCGLLLFLWLGIKRSIIAGAEAELSPLPGLNWPIVFRFFFF